MSQEEAHPESGAIGPSSSNNSVHNSEHTIPSMFTNAPASQSCSRRLSPSEGFVSSHTPSQRVITSFHLSNPDHDLHGVGSQLWVDDYEKDAERASFATSSPSTFPHHNSCDYELYSVSIDQYMPMDRYLAAPYVDDGAMLDLDNMMPIGCPCARQAKIAYVLHQLDVVLSQI